ncbi:hypothetical protein OSB04_023025 [Centaurea solstitialis]|uniref:Uncharacterized protein n=1 Tax=Centaurea solstitialis TaxID=347529 RepID=A0AA38SQV4_9ASTR|nr:hypothetical protein OSB04_023025 [Centaurea solstitialis]
MSTTSTAAAIISLICILSSISAPFAAPAPSANGGGKDEESFVIVGQVYCDPCRIQFPLDISYPVPNAKVILECRERENSAVTYTTVGMTDAKGMYNITAPGDHEEEICDVFVRESPDSKCPEVMDYESLSRVSLTDKNGVRGRTRNANPIGFMIKEIDPRCYEILKNMGLTN